MWSMSGRYTSYPTLEATQGQTDGFFSHLPTLDFTRSNCKNQSRTWSTSDLLHVLKSPLLVCIPFEILETDFCNCSAYDLGWHYKEV